MAEGMASTDPANRFEGWSLERLYGGYRICKLLRTSPRLTGAADEMVHDIALELLREIDAKEDEVSNARSH